MDWNRVEGNWKQVKGKVKEQWGKLSDDDLTTINGRRDQLEGKIQERVRLSEGSSQEGCRRLVQSSDLVSLSEPRQLHLISNERGPDHASWSGPRHASSM
jgi:uncharacterized protein YjbJ (UPF0337 family)